MLVVHFKMLWLQFLFLIKVYCFSPALTTSQSFLTVFFFRSISIFNKKKRISIQFHNKSLLVRVHRLTRYHFLYLQRSSMLKKHHPCKFISDLHYVSTFMDIDTFVTGLYEYIISNESVSECTYCISIL